MSGSVARVFPFAPAARASIDMLDEAENLLLAAGDIGAAGHTLWNYPNNANALADAKAAALRVLHTIARIEGSLEALCGPMGRQ